MIIANSNTQFKYPSQATVAPHTATPGKRGRQGINPRLSSCKPYGLAPQPVGLLCADNVVTINTITALRYENRIERPAKNVMPKQGEKVGYPEQIPKRSGGADEGQSNMDGTFGAPAPSRSNPAAICGISEIEPGIRDGGGQK
jgi:hypothetical protein